MRNEKVKEYPLSCDTNPVKNSILKQVITGDLNTFNDDIIIDIFKNGLSFSLLPVPAVHCNK